ncbi:hypothetical protein [Pedobacter gandavensis]|uniref:hypothetical protein n=1 Tax=Pedobacter gandavensis TaxID=2679963 RepID=UPI00292F1B04|nr:hypothetical protein [Pedobacter gandavensis]
MELKKILLWAGGVVLMLWAIGKCNESNGIGIDQLTAATSTSKQKDSNPQYSKASKELSLVDTADATPEYKWLYYDDEDKMTSKKDYYAELIANEELEFGFPYNGGSVATLILRKKRDENHVILQISKGQFIHNYSGASVKVRFGDSKANVYSISRPADHSSDVVFIDNTARFISNLKKHKKLLIEAEFYKEGSRQMAFDIEGFKWDH